MPIADLTVSTEELPGSQVGLTVEVPQAEVDRAFDRVLQRLQQRVKIEGFRPGKAPRGLVEARVGPVALREEAIELLVPEVVGQALQDRAIEAIDRPRVEIDEFERGRAARFRARVTVYPEVRLPDLDAIRVEKRSTEVTDEMVDRRIEELREGAGELLPVERAAAVGDVVVADIDAVVDGVEVPSERRRAIEADVREGVLIPQLLAVVPGKSAGETAEAVITLAEDHVDESLRGKQAQIRFTVQGVKERRLPDLDDEFAARVSEGRFATVGALRDGVRADLEETSRRLAELSFEQDVVKAVVEGATLEVPAALVDEEVHRQMHDLEDRLGKQGLRLDRYLAYLGKTPDDWVAEARPEAESRIRVDLVLEEAGKVLGVEPGDEEVLAHMRDEANRDEELKERYLELVANRTARDYFRHRLRRLQILARLVEKAGGKPAAPAASETSAAPSESAE